VIFPKAKIASKDGEIFLANFGLAKAAIYLIPLFIAAMAPPDVYGGIEFAWAAALMAATFLVGAPIAGATQRHLIGKDQEVLDELALITVVGCLMGAVAWGIAQTWGFAPYVLIAVASFGAAIVHNALSGWFRMRGQRNRTAWADGTATIIAGFIVLALALALGRLSVASVTYAYAAFSVAAGFAALILFMRIKNADWPVRFKRSLVIGIPMLAGSILAMWLGVGGRITMGALAPTDVAVYSLAFRVAGLTLGIHQLAITALFARLYKARTRQADSLMSPFLIAIALLNIMLALLAPWIMQQFHFAALPESDRGKFAAIIPIVCFQVFCWIAFAMLQVRINRSKLAGKAFWPILWVTVIGAGLIFASASFFKLGVVGISWGIGIHSAAYFVAEWVVLARARLPHFKIGLVALAGGVALGLIAVSRLVSGG
jgi:O-antigen/teichoic acid export membrane protein